MKINKFTQQPRGKESFANRKTTPVKQPLAELIKQINNIGQIGQQPNSKTSSEIDVSWNPEPPLVA